MKKLLFTGICFVLFSSIVSCNSGGSGIDAELLENSSCQPPCWQGLTPGESTSKDVDQFLANLSFKDWPERNIRSSIHNRKWIRILSASNSKVVDIYLENETLLFIHSWDSIRANLGQIVERFGQPEFYEAIFSDGPEERLYDVEVYYPKQGLAFIVSANAVDAGNIFPNMLIKDVQYFSPGNLRSYFTQRFSYGYVYEDSITEAVQFQLERFVLPWTGFGKVKIVSLRP